MLRRLLVAAVLLFLVAGGALAIYVWRETGSSTPVDTAAAVRRERAAQPKPWHGPPPAPGVYPLALKGWECGGIGPICLRRSLPSHGLMVVTRRPGTLTIEVDLSRQHLEAQRYLLARRGRLLAWQRTRITMAGITSDDHRAAVPPPLSTPARLRVGQRWTERFRVGDVRVSARNLVLRRDMLVVGGRRCRTFVIQSVSLTAGPHPGTERDLSWFCPALGLDLRDTVSRRITGTFPYKLELDARLLRATPER
jgi:hypothetical protein